MFPLAYCTHVHSSIRLPGGRLETQLDRITLVSRQQAFGNAIKAKRDRLKPRSRNLAICKGLVAGLENGFDGMAPQASKISSRTTYMKWKWCGDSGCGT